GGSAFRAMMVPSGTEPAPDQSFSTTPTCWLGMYRVVSQASRAAAAATRAATTPAVVRAFSVAASRAKRLANKGREDIRHLLCKRLGPNGRAFSRRKGGRRA